VIEIGYLRQVRIVLRDAGEHARAAVAVLRGDQTMGVVSTYERDRRKLRSPHIGHPLLIRRSQFP